MGEPNKIVSNDTKLIAIIKVKRVGSVTVNPNGRGYEADNVKHSHDEELLSFTLQGKDKESLAKKVEIAMLTLDEDA